MKHLKIRFTIVCGLVALTAASIAPIVAKASCPDIIVRCPDGRERNCVGTQDGDKCKYSADCLNCAPKAPGSPPSPE